MQRRHAVLLCLSLLLAFRSADWVVKGQQDEAYLTNISIEENNSKQVLNYSLKANISGKEFRSENPRIGIIRSEVEKAMEIGKEHRIYTVAHQLLPDCTSSRCGGHLDIKSVCSIYDYLLKGDDKKKGWYYSDDPIVAESFQKAIQSLDCGGKSVASGDCDDYAIAISTLIENVGGATMILLAKTKNRKNPEQHMYPMVFLGYKNDADNVKKIEKWLNYKYKTSNIRAECFFNKDSTYWLNLDWCKDYPYPGACKPMRDPDFIRETNGSKRRMELSRSDPVVVIQYNKSLLAAEEPIWFDASRSKYEDGGISHIEWIFDDNSSNSNIPNATHTYEKPGNYNLTLKLTDNMGDVNCTTISLSIGKPRPLDIVFMPRLPKVREDIVFKAGIKGRKHYNWSFGDESHQQGANLSICRHSYRKAGRYLVNLTTIDDKNRSRSNVSWIVVNDPPHAKIEWDPYLPNVKEKISFSGKDSTDDLPLKYYIWSFGDGTNATGRDVSHAYDNGGSYLVSLRVIDEYNYTDDALETVEVNSPPSAHFSFYPSSPTTDDNVLFDASLSSDPNPKSSIKAYEWDFGDRKKGSGLYPEHRYEKEGNYTVKLTVFDDNDQKDTTPPLMIRVQSKNVLHPPMAHINFVPEKSITTEDEVIFDAAWSSDVDGYVNAYNWELDDGTRCNKSSFSHRFSKEGEHIVNLTVKDEDNLNNSISRRLSVVKPKGPIAFFTCKPDILEAGKEITFNGSSSQGDIVSYRWDFGDTSPGKEGAVVNYIYSPKGFKAASYNVTLTVMDKREKENSSSKELTVEPAKTEPLVPLFVFQPERPVAGEEVTFNATSSNGSIKSYEWNYGDGSSTGTKAIENHTFPANESVEVTYEVVLTLTDINGDKSRISKNIKVSLPPPPPLQPLFTYQPQNPVVGQQVVFDATSSKGAIANYLWDFGDGSAQKDEAIVAHAFTASPSSTRTYGVTLTVAEKTGKKYNSTRKVTVVPPEFPTINSLWIETENKISQYHTCQIYDQITMIANSYGGNAIFTEQYPDGEEKFKPYFFNYGRNEITFAADRLGEHILGYKINNKYSNIIIIYVVEQGQVGEYTSPLQESYSTQPAYTSLNQMQPIYQGTASDMKQSAYPAQSFSSFPTHYPGQSSYPEESQYPYRTSQSIEDWLSG